MKLLFRDALVIDGTGQEPFTGYVLVEGDSIQEVGKGQPHFNSGSIDREINCQGMSLLPGLINCHVHLAMDGSAHPMNKLAAGDSNAALIQAVISARNMLRAGFTTVRDCGGREGEILTLRGAINSGRIEGPRIISCCQAILITGGHFTGVVADGPVEVRKAARKMLHNGADFVKVMATGGVGKQGEKPGAQELLYDELAEASRVAEVAGRHSAAHAHGPEGIRDCVRAGISSIEHCTYLEAETAEEMARKGTFLVPTFAPYAIMIEKGEAGGLASYMVASSRTIMEEKIPRFRYALKAGVKIAFGTDAGSPLNSHDNIVVEAREMVAAGCTSMQVITSLTSSAAELLRLDAMIGTVAAGKIADLVLVKGNPLEDVAALGQVAMVVKEGQVVRE